MMDEEKLQQRKRRALAERRLPAYEAAVTALGDHYANVAQHRRALAVYTEAIGVFAAQPTCRMQLGRAHRMCGEMHMLLEDFTAAGTHVEKFLRIAQQQENAVEEQRAYATIGRVHLLHGQSLAGGSSSAADGETNRRQVQSAAVLRRAEAAFQRSLAVSKRLADSSIGRVERIDMQARLYLNLGVTRECLGDLGETEAHMERALQLCRDHNLYELLHQCYVTTASFVFNKRADTTKALRLLSLALALAGERLDKRRRCETLIARADIFIRSADFQSARQSLHRAYRLRTPVDADRRLIEQQLRTVVAISQAEDRLVTTSSTDHMARRSLFELLGDGACQLRNYEKALDYYGMMLASAEKCFVSERELVPIYVSLYQTYMDLGRFEEALVYLRKEYELVRETPAEAIATLMNIGDALESCGKDFWAIDEVLQEARRHAAKMATRSLETRILRRMVRLRTKHKMMTLVEVLRDEAAAVGIVLENRRADAKGEDDDEEDDDDDDDSSSSGQEATQKNTLDIGGDINLDELSGSEADDGGGGNDDDIDNNAGKPKTKSPASARAGNEPADGAHDSSITSRRRRVRRPAAGGAGTVKRNEKGETALHQACISGNIAQVGRLLEQSHPVNVRDFAGWMPLHEAANHGHVDVVRLLLERGAWINDKGGKMCDGVTALHDACGNGCLEVVEMLLDAGANATMRTDLCEMPVDTLEKWRRAQDQLDADEKTAYDRVHGRLLQHMERTGVSRVVPAQETPTRTQCGVNARTPRTGSAKRAQTSQSARHRRSPSASSTDSDAGGRRQQSPPRRTIDTMLADEFATQQPTHDDDDDDSSRSPPPSPPSASAPMFGAPFVEDACSDYRNVMAALRKTTSPLKRHVSAEESRAMIKRRAGILDEQEVGENWLDEDIVTTAPKKAKLLTLGSGGGGSAFPSTSKTRVIPREQHRSKENNQPNRLTSSALSGSSASSFNGFSGSSSMISDESSLDAFDVMMNPSNKVSSSTVRQRRISNPPAAPTDQRNSLLHAGFVQFKMAATPAEEAAGENVVSSTRMECEPAAAAPVTPVIPKLVAGTTFKVRVGEQLLNVPVNNDMIADLTIGWLAEETSRRYYNLKGLQPVLEITSSDGAVFERSDPLAVVLGTTVGSNVLEWILPSVAQRYMESCRQLQTVPDDHIKSTLELIQATHQLVLTDQPPLRADVCRSLCRAIHHQANIDTIDLSRCCLEDDGFRHLVDALDTIRPKTMRLSGNQITVAGLSYLTKKLSTTKTTTTPATAATAASFLACLEVLDLSFNPLGGGTAELHTVLEHCPALRALRVASVGLRQLDSGHLIGLTELDVRHNELTGGALRKMLQQLNACKIAELRLGFCGGGAIGNGARAESTAVWAKHLAEFLQTGTLHALRVLDVSGWQLDDSDVYEVVQTLRRTPQMDALWASENRQLGAIGFAHLVRSLRVRRMYLDGCVGVVRHLGAQHWSEGGGGGDDGGKCAWVRLPKFADTHDAQVLRDFWAHLHGARATVTCSRASSVLEVQDP